MTDYKGDWSSAVSAEFNIVSQCMLPTVSQERHTIRSVWHT